MFIPELLKFPRPRMARISNNLNKARAHEMYNVHLASCFSRVLSWMKYTPQIALPPNRLLKANKSSRQQQPIHQAPIRLALLLRSQRPKDERFIDGAGSWEWSRVICAGRASRVLWIKLRLLHVSSCQSFRAQALDIAPPNSGRR